LTTPYKVGYIGAKLNDEEPSELGEFNTGGSISSLTQGNEVPRLCISSAVIHGKIKHLVHDVSCPPFIVPEWPICPPARESEEDDRPASGRSLSMRTSVSVSITYRQLRLSTISPVAEALAARPGLCSVYGHHAICNRCPSMHSGIPSRAIHHGIPEPLIVWVAVHYSGIANANKCIVRYLRLLVCLFFVGHLPPQH
jgi:hypothetical protein